MIRITRLVSVIAVVNMLPLPALAVEGGALYLNRHGVETHRAEFDYADDCKLIAQAMSEKEPAVKWYCSTSEVPVSYKCKIHNVTFKGAESKSQEASDLEFGLELSRGVATSTLQIPMNTFRYQLAGNVLKLTNDYKYVEGNLYSAAVAYIRIDATTGNSQVLSFDLKGNGEGQCSLVPKAN